MVYTSHFGGEVELKEVVDGPEPGGVVLEGSLVADGEGTEVGHQATQEVDDSNHCSILEGGREGGRKGGREALILLIKLFWIA